jgi:DNA-binding MarR family transcriptional regulator
MRSDLSQLAELGLAIKRAQWRHHRELDRRLGAIGGSLAQWDALRQIDRNPDASMHRLAELTFQTDQSFGALAGRLFDRGLVERVPGPGRAHHHRLTAAGRQLLSDGQRQADEALSESFAPLDKHERARLLELLKRLNRDSHDTGATGSRATTSPRNDGAQASAVERDPIPDSAVIRSPSHRRTPR